MNRMMRYALYHKKKTVAFLFLVALFVGSVLCNQLYGAVVLALALMAILLNEVVKLRLSHQVKCFGAQSKIRNVDCLVIGDLCDVPALPSWKKEYKTIVLTSPGRSLTSAYEILRHTFCILKENKHGVVAENPVVFITLQKKYIDDGYSFFDYPVFRMSPTTVKRLGVEKFIRQYRFPIVFSPVKSLWFLLNSKAKYSEKMSNVPADIKDFCNIRNIRLEILLR